MKKYFSLVLVAICLAMIATSTFSAIAEVPAVAIIEKPAAVDLTQVVIAVVLVVFNFLLAWIIKAVIPPIRQWLEARTTKEQRGLLYGLIQTLVNAAEQIIGQGKGNEKLQYVIGALRAKGYTVDIDMIEAAVKEMNDIAEARFIEALKGGLIDEDGDPEDDEADEDVEEIDPDN